MKRIIMFFASATLFHPALAALAAWIAPVGTTALQFESGKGVLYLRNPATIAGFDKAVDALLGALVQEDGKFFLSVGTIKPKS